MHIFFFNALAFLELENGRTEEGLFGFFFLIVCMRCMSGSGYKKRVLDLLEQELQAMVSHLHGCWDFNSGPLREQTLSSYLFSPHEGS